MGACGKELVSSKCFKHSHCTSAPRRRTRSKMLDEKYSGQRVLEGQHGNYPWVGCSRYPLGKILTVGYFGGEGSGLTLIDGIGPCPLNMEGIIGGYQTHGTHGLPVTHVDRWGSPLFVAIPLARPKSRVYETNQRFQPRSIARAKLPNGSNATEQAEVPAYLRFCINNFGQTEMMSLADRTINTRPGPGAYEITDLSCYRFKDSKGTTFAPIDNSEGKRSKLGRSCDMHCAPPRPHEKLVITREHGPLFCKKCARLARRATMESSPEQNLLHHRTCSSCNSCAYTRPSSSPFLPSSANTLTSEGRPTLKTFLQEALSRSLMSAGSGDGRGGPSFRFHHTVFLLWKNNISKWCVTLQFWTP